MSLAERIDPEQSHPSFCFSHYGSGVAAAELESWLAAHRARVAAGCHPPTANLRLGEPCEEFPYIHEVCDATHGGCGATRILEAVGFSLPWYTERGFLGVFRA